MKLAEWEVKRSAPTLILSSAATAVPARTVAPASSASADRRNAAANRVVNIFAPSPEDCPKPPIIQKPAGTEKSA